MHVLYHHDGKAVVGWAVPLASQSLAFKAEEFVAQNFEKKTEPYAFSFYKWREIEKEIND
jgi:hypothetical protein